MMNALLIVSTIWTDRVRNEVFHRFNQEINILHAKKKEGR